MPFTSLYFTVHRMSRPVHYKNFICVNNSRSTKVVFKEGKTEGTMVRPKLLWVTR